MFSSVDYVGQTLMDISWHQFDDESHSLSCFSLLTTQVCFFVIVLLLAFSSRGVLRELSGYPAVDSSNLAMNSYV